MTEPRRPESPPEHADQEAGERVVVRDNRKLGGARSGDEPTSPPGPTADEAGDPAVAVADPAGAVSGPAGAVSGPAGAVSGPAGAEAATEQPEDQSAEAETIAVEPVVEPVVGEIVEDAPPVPPLGAELEALRSELDERTADLQRVTAEYANYRKRVDRDRALVVEQATGNVLATLLPILDDLDRAREHGDLVGPFGAVAEHLTTTLGKFGLTPFGEKGDRFDPTRHEAVAHRTSPDVTEPTCVEVMRRGYLLGDRMLRPALVAVADPE